MSDCSILCCGPQPNQYTATRTANPTILPLDRCNNQTEYFAADGTYTFGQAVKATTTAGTVEVTADGSDAIGIVICSTKEITAADTGRDRKIVVARTGHVYWSDIAAAYGTDLNDQAKWWEIHVALAKLNIYVRYR